MFICSCKGITKQEIEEAALETGSNHCDSEFFKHCEAGSVCGGCQPQINRILEAADRDQGMTAAQTSED